MVIGAATAPRRERYHLRAHKSERYSDGLMQRASELHAGIARGVRDRTRMRPATSSMQRLVKYRKIPSQPHRPPPQIRKPCDACYGCQANYQEFGLVETLHHAVPFFPQKVT